MNYYELKLTAGESYKQDVPGTLLLIDKIVGADSVDITLIVGGVERKSIPDRRAAFRYKTRFDGVIFKADADCTVKVFLTFEDVNLGFSDGAEVSVDGTVEVTNGPGDPIPVSVSGGVTLTASNVGINNNNAAAVPVKNQALFTIVDYSEVTIPGIVAISLVADATLRRLRIRNSHASAKIALGGASVSLDDCPIQLLPGEVFIEDDAPGAGWYVITDTPGATVQLQGIK